MKKHVRFIALLVVLLMSVALFAGCTDGDTKETTPAPSGGTTTPGPVVETTTPEPKNYNGYEFTIGNGGRYFPQSSADGGYISALHDEWADAYLELENRLNITLETVDFGGSHEERLEQLTAASMSGTLIADLLRGRQRTYWPAARANSILAVDGDELKNAGLNAFDETRWYVPAVEQTKLFDKHWGLEVASKYVPVPSGYFVNFNKDLVASVAGNYDLYQMTRDKTWTWDIYRTIAKATTKDTDGDNVPDIWGTAATAWGNEAVSNGVQFIGQDANGKWVVTINNHAGMSALQFLYDMNFGDGTRADIGSGDNRRAFAEGFRTFNWSAMGHINGPGETIFNSNHDYGILPMPLGPNATEYVSMHNDLDLMFIQTTHKDLDTLVGIMNEWALIVNDTESYLEILDDGRCRTPEDKEMMVDYILPNFKLNYANMTAEIWDAIDEGIVSGVSYNNLTPSAAVQEWEPVAQAALDAFFGQ